MGVVIQLLKVIVSFEGHEFRMELVPQLQPRRLDSGVLTERQVSQTGFRVLHREVIAELRTGKNPSLWDAGTHQATPEGSLFLLIPMI